MTNEQIKQAYVTGLAARGLLRQMCKQAEGADPGSYGFRDYKGDKYYEEGKGNFGLDIAKDYAAYGAGGAGLGAIIGSLIALARQKSLVSGALVGGGVGAGIGLGHRGLRHIPGYRNSDLNLLDNMVINPGLEALGKLKSES